MFLGLIIGYNPFMIHLLIGTFSQNIRTNTLDNFTSLLRRVGTLPQGTTLLVSVLQVFQLKTLVIKMMNVGGRVCWQAVGRASTVAFRSITLLLFERFEWYLMGL